MLSLILAVVVSASGDPYILRHGAPTVLSVDQDAALQTLVLSRFASVTFSNVYSVECESEDNIKPWRCVVSSWATPSWADIRASLLAGKTWLPGQGATVNTWLVTIEKAFVASAAWRAHAQTVWAELLDNPMLRLSYVRQNGTGAFVASIEYKRSTNQSGIATAVNAGETLVPLGVTP